VKWQYYAFLGKAVPSSLPPIGKLHRRPVLMMHLVQNQSTPFSKLEINDNGIELSVVQ
jgi:hypothetical protein